MRSDEALSWRDVKSALDFLGFMAFAGFAPGSDAGAAEPGPVAHLGTNLLTGGRPLFFRAPLNAYGRAQLAKIGTNVTQIPAALVLPEDWRDRRTIPLLVICSPGGAPAIPQLRAYTNVAVGGGWAVLAADGPSLSPDKDSALWCWGTVSSALDQLHAALPGSRDWPLAIGGFSGGAKKAGCIAGAALQAKYDVWGVFMGGCNEDRATLGALLFQAGPRFLETPMFLSNGTQDPIAGPNHGQAVRASMERTGFKRVRSSTYAGAHRLEERQLEEALRWFSENAAARHR